MKVVQGDLPGALDAYTAAMDIAKSLAEADKDNAGWQRDLSVSLNRIADVKVDQGDLTGALNAYSAAMDIAKTLAEEIGELVSQGVRVSVLGDRARLTSGGRAAVDRVEAETRSGTRLALNLCISYSSRAEIARAARLLTEEVLHGTRKIEEVDEQALAGRLYTAPWGDPDLLIRTSGEQRISNFLLWQLAYTELYLTPVLWPDFNRRTLFEAILDYQRRERRFGTVTAG